MKEKYNLKLAISNIAWNVEEEGDIFPLLKEMDVEGIEIAPTKYWPNPSKASTQEIEVVRSRINSFGFRIPSAQALLYGHPDLTIFRDEETRKRSLEYIINISLLCSSLGVSTLVFGSPKNRQRNGLPLDLALEIASDFFFQVAENISTYNITLCIEPNPIEYGCDFITNSADALILVQRVDHPNFRLHLDTSAMFLNREDPASIIVQCFPYLHHFHISEPYLGLIGYSQNDHLTVAKTLRKSGYDGWISIEMRSGLKASNKDAIHHALEYVKKTYMEQ